MQKVASLGSRSKLNGGSNRRAFMGDSKRAVDLTLACVAIVLILPLLLTVAGLILLAQGKPILIRHKRIGRKGETFDCLKFRTMVTDGDAVLSAHLAANLSAQLEWEATHKLKHDPRVTALGQVLRQSSVDELPQLFNVLCGEMSLVGPRPIVASEIVKYGPRYDLYKKVRPGLTGAWQISGRSDVSYAKRVEMDAEYVQNQSLVKDMSIIVKTIPAILSARGSY